MKDPQSTNQSSDLRPTTLRIVENGRKLISRSEAKRVLRCALPAGDVILDFKGVELVGQGFADEIFRVWARMHPETHFVPVSMCEPVAFMVERAIRRAEDED